MVRREQSVDMSPEAIAQRLKDLSELYELGMALRGARRLGKVEEIRGKEAIDVRERTEAIPVAHAD